MPKPIFKSVFPNEWSKMHLVLRKRYANREQTDDSVLIEGKLNIQKSIWMQCLHPFLTFAGLSLPPAGKAIPTTVELKNHPKIKNRINFNRTFKYSNKKTYAFNSTISPTQKNETVECIHFGLGHLMQYELKGSELHLTHKGYIWKNHALPLEYILGRAYATEIPLSDDTFALDMQIKHPFFGTVFSYSGTLKVINAPES